MQHWQLMMDEVTEVCHLPVLHFPSPSFMIGRHFPVLQIQVTPSNQITVLLSRLVTVGKRSFASAAPSF